VSLLFSLAPSFVALQSEVGPTSSSAPAAPIAESQANVMFVTGPRGVGKSTAVAAAVRVARDRDRQIDAVNETSVRQNGAVPQFFYDIYNLLRHIYSPKRSCRWLYPMRTCTSSGKGFFGKKWRRRVCPLPAPVR